MANQNLRYYTAANEFMRSSFAAVDNQLVPLHLERTVTWLLQLSPEADEAQLTAAISHDIERAFREDHVYQKMFLSDQAFNDPEFLNYHQRRGAMIISDFLKTISCPETFSKEVSRLVAHHETGGDYDTNLLKDADSLSFFQTNVDLFINVKVKESSVDKVRNKFIWMFERMSGLKAKELCRPFYENARDRLARLENRRSEQ